MSKSRSSSRRGPIRSVGGSFAGGLRRSLGLLAFVPLAGRAPQYGRLVWALVTDERTPAPRKALLAGALGYLLLGRDLVPDDVPILGGLDDLVVVVLAVDLFLDGVPRDVLEEKLDELGIEHGAFDRDVAQIRRLTPGPIRRAVRRLPRMLEVAGHTIDRAGFGPRLRSWLEDGGPGARPHGHTEDSIA